MEAAGLGHVIIVTVRVRPCEGARSCVSQDVGPCSLSHSFSYLEHADLSAAETLMRMLEWLWYNCPTWTWCNDCCHRVKCGFNIGDVFILNNPRPQH